MSHRVQRSALVLVVVLLVIPLVLGGCSRGDSAAADSKAQAWKIEPSPPKRGPAVVTFEPLYDDGAPIVGATLDFEGNMNHAGMRPVLGSMRETEPGVYVSDGFEFTMGGDWFVTIRGTLPDGSPYETRIDVEGVGG